MAAEIAAVFSLGSTEQQCIFALEYIGRKEGLQPDLYFLYGEPYPNQKTRTPLDAIADLKPKLAAMGLNQVTWRGTQASSLDACYRVVMELMKELSDRSYRRVYLGITGGANPMVAALFHAGMTELHGEVIAFYVQGAPGEGGIQQSIEVVQSTSARDMIVSARVLALARSGRMQAAAAFAADLPSRGPSGFLREAVELLAAWDQFDYSVAGRLAMMRSRAYDQPPHGRLAALAATVLRYIPIAQRIAGVESLVATPEAFTAAAANPGWRQRLEGQGGFWLSVDALANATRRAAEGAFTDAVMRAYRAVELSLQYRLFRLGVYPSALDWTKPPLAAIASSWQVRGREELPKHVAFEESVRLLEVLESANHEDTKDARRTIQIIRNSCYLEHGYERVKKGGCASCLEKATSLCGHFLQIGGRIEGYLNELQILL